MTKQRFTDPITLSLRKEYRSEFRSWYGMQDRCYNANSVVWQRYGGRGIRVCDRWRGSFFLFLCDMGKKPNPSYSLDRINNDGNYEPCNCRWASVAEQARNRRHAALPTFIETVTYNGETLSVDEWAQRTGIPKHVIINRLQRKWSVERALTTLTLKEKGRLQREFKIEYNTWCAMRERCFNKNNPAFVNYGGRGITVCDRWVKSFQHFLEDVGCKPTPKHSLDRINNDGNYEPGNVRWATPIQQVRNTRRNRVFIHNGEAHCLSEWAEIYGIDKDMLWCRISRGWSFERAISEGKDERSMDKKITVDGVTKTFAQWCRDRGLSYQIVLFRLKKGMTPEEALNPHKKTLSDAGKIGGKRRWKNPRLLTYKGVTKTLSEWATGLGISYSAVLNRWRKGYPVEKILSPERMSFSEAGRRGCQIRWEKKRSRRK